jgi:hypothetical protein
MGDFVGNEEDVQENISMTEAIAENYFGHTRVEDFVEDKTRRVIELQSDLFQKGALENEEAKVNNQIEYYEDEIEYAKEWREGRGVKELEEKLKEARIIARESEQKVKDRQLELMPLYQYNDPTAHFRMVREEVRQAALDGIETLVFPKGETAMKIEGLNSDVNVWSDIDVTRELDEEDLIVGNIVARDSGNTKWLITDVLENGKFKAIGTRLLNQDIESVYPTSEEYMKAFVENEEAYRATSVETFDLNPTVDTSNPVFRFYESTLGKYLQKEYDAGEYISEGGNKWWMIKIKPEHKQAVEAFRLDNLVDYGKISKKISDDKQIHEEVILREAYNFDKLEDFLEHYRGSATQYGSYTPALRKHGVNPESARISELGVDPEIKVTIYRGIDDSEGRIRSPRIVDGDYVTTDYDSANSYSGGRVISQDVKAKDLIVEFESDFTPDDPFYVGAEYIYSDSRNEIIKYTDEQLKELYKKAQASGAVRSIDEWEQEKAYILKNGEIPDSADMKGFRQSEFYGMYGKSDKDTVSEYYDYISDKVEKLEAQSGVVKYRLEEDNLDADVEIPLPELITIATDIGTDISLSSRLKKSLGVFQSRNNVPAHDTKIKLLRALFEPQGEEMINAATGEVERLPETPEQIAARVKAIERTLGHEIGHLFDWFGGSEENMNTLNRGNILGRIGNFIGYLKHTLMSPDQQSEYESLKSEAKQLQEDRRRVKGKDKAEYKELGKRLRVVNKQITVMEEDILAKMPEVMTELKTLTHLWKPFDETIDEDYTKYRYRSEELYADAMSVLFNNPKMLKETAPTFYQAFTEYLARKPEVKELYFKIKDSIKEGANIQARVDQMIKNQYEAQGKRMTIEQEKEEYKKQAKWERVTTKLKMGFQDDYAPYLDMLRKEWKKGGIELSKLEESEQLMGSLRLKGNDAVKYAEDVQEQFFKPVSEAGIDVETVGNILILERNLGDRVDLANPQGLMYDYAKETYDAVKNSLTPAKWAFLQEKLEWWRDYNFELVKQGYEAGVYSEQFFDEIATVNKNTYTPFAVVHYIEDNYVTAGVIQAKGTLKGVENPLNTQMMKSLSLMQLTARNGAKQHIIKTLQEVFPENIHKAKAIRAEGGRFVRFEKNAKLEREGYTQLELLEDGKRTAYYVDKYIADMFERNYGGVGWEIARIATFPIRMINRIFKPAVTILKASFQFYSNPLKDYSRSVTNLTALSGLFDEGNVALRTGKVFKAFTREWIKSLKTSWDYAGDKMDAITQKMLDMYVLSSNVKYEDIELGTDKFKFDPVKNRIVYKGSVNWMESLRDFAAKVPIVKNTLVPVYDFYIRAGATLEVNSKVAGFKYLSKQVGEEKAALYTRKYVGTPDYMQGGKFTQLTNEIFVFSNVGVQALNADSQLATRPKTASGYWFSMVSKTVLPKLLMLLGSSILRVPIPDPDDEDKTIWVNPYDYLSEYYKGMYMSFPIGYDPESEKFLFGKVPQDEVSTIVGDLVWKMGTYLQGEGMKAEQLASAIAGLVPFLGGDNPLLSIGRSWLQYAQGRNPYDDFRGRLAINQSKWNEGGITRFTEMLKWTTNELGVSNFQTYDKDFNTTFEHILEAPILERMFELTDYGIQERELYNEMMGKRAKSKELDKALQDYFAQPSDKNLLKYQQEYVTSIKGQEPEGGWHGTELAEKTRLESEFKREVLAQSGSEYKKIAKNGLTNDEKVEILDNEMDKRSKQEQIDYLSQVVRYEVVKGEMFAEYAKDNDLSDDIVYQVVRASIPVLDGDSNNTLLWELRKRDMISDEALSKLYRQDKLITRKGYSKYKELDSEVYEKRYVREEDEEEDERNRLF